MLDYRREQRPHISRRPGAKKTPPITGIKNEPRQEYSHESPDEAGNQVIAWYCNIEHEKNGGIGKRHSATGEVVNDPPNGPLILQGVGLNYVLVYKLSTEDAQMPSTDGRASSSSAPSDLQLVGTSVNDVHHDGAGQSAQQGTVEQFHGIPPDQQSVRRQTKWTYCLQTVTSQICDLRQFANAYLLRPGEIIP